MANLPILSIEAIKLVQAHLNLSRAKWQKASFLVETLYVRQLSTGWGLESEVVQGAVVELVRSSDRFLLNRRQSPV